MSSREIMIFVLLARAVTSSLGATALVRAATSGSVESPLPAPMALPGHRHVEWSMPAEHWWQHNIELGMEGQVHLKSHKFSRHCETVSDSY